jgi:hypothetical protein
VSGGADAMESNPLTAAPPAVSAASCRALLTRVLVADASAVSLVGALRFELEAGGEGGVRRLGEAAAGELGDDGSRSRPKSFLDLPPSLWAIWPNM